MKRFVALAAGLALIVAAAFLVVRRPATPPAEAPPEPKAPAGPPGRIAGPRAGADPPGDAGKMPAPPPLTAAEKAARLEKIKRDYDEIRTTAAAEYGRLGAKFPGGLNAFLKQLALLELEKRRDYAQFLTPRELEDLLLLETNAGQLVKKLLADTAATDEQRRAAFRLQLAFDDAHAMKFDLTPRVLHERETARQRLQEEIRGVLGDALFASWLRGEGGEFAQFQQFAAEQGLPPSTALDLWRAKNEFTRRRLELNAQTAQAPVQTKIAQQALIQQTETRVFAIVGATAMPAARQRILDWLPKR